MYGFVHVRTTELDSFRAIEYFAMHGRDNNDSMLCCQFLKVSQYIAVAALRQPPLPRTCRISSRRLLPRPSPLPWLYNHWRPPRNVNDNN